MAPQFGQTRPSGEARFLRIADAAVHNAPTALRK